MQQIALQNCRLTVLNLIKEVIYLRQISGNKLLVKALKEEGVTTLFGYPGACTIDISDELYRQSGIDNKLWCMKLMLMQERPVKSVSVL